MWNATEISLSTRLRPQSHGELVHDTTWDAELRNIPSIPVVLMAIDIAPRIGRRIALGCATERMHVQLCRDGR